MEVEIFVDCRTGFTSIRIGAWIMKNGESYFRSVESIMPEGQCADWAEKFWDAAYKELKP